MIQRDQKGWENMWMTSSVCGNLEGHSLWGSQKGRVPSFFFFFFLGRIASETQLSLDSLFWEGRIRLGTLSCPSNFRSSLLTTKAPIARAQSFSRSDKIWGCIHSKSRSLVPHVPVGFCVLLWFGFDFQRLVFSLVRWFTGSKMASTSY